jgi:hypothetical protein
MPKHALHLVETIGAQRNVASVRMFLCKLEPRHWGPTPFVPGLRLRNIRAKHAHGIRRLSTSNPLTTSARSNDAYTAQIVDLIMQCLIRCGERASRVVAVVAVVRGVPMQFVAPRDVRHDVAERVRLWHFSLHNCQEILHSVVETAAAQDNKSQANAGSTKASSCITHCMRRYTAARQMSTLLMRV